MSDPLLGKPVDRVDARLKVTGAALYAGDNKPDRVAYGYVVTSTIARGTITGMNTAVASKAPGVLAVYTPFDAPRLLPYARTTDNDERIPPLQDAEVRYYGQLVAFVVAETFEQARDAATLVEVAYAPADARLSFIDTEASPTAVDVLAPGVGSIDDALAASEVTVSRTYTTSMQTHNAMEPHATVAEWAGEDLTIYTATQGVRLVVARLAETLDVDPERIRVHNPYVGGGFGGKWGNWAHTPLTAAVARVLGRPIKTVLTREQVFTVVGHRPAVRQTVSLGAAADGTLTAIKHTSVSVKSASSTFFEPAANSALAAYRTANLHVSRGSATLDVAPTTIMEAPYEANGSFALESAIDELACELGLDPLDLRRKNYATTVPSSGLPWSSKHLDECYDLGAEQFGWSRRESVPGSVIDGDHFVGLGMATAGYSARRGKAAIEVALRADGTATVSGTGADLGTGQATVFAILTADSLGIPITRVEPRLGDSSLPSAANAGGSASTSTNGPAVQAAAEAAKAALISLAVEDERSPFFGLRREEVEYRAGLLASVGRAIGFPELLTLLGREAVAATVTSESNKRSDHGFRSFGVHLCEVRVDRWTRLPRVSRWLTVVDAGTIVNAKAARGQIMGGVTMGLGQALLESTLLEPETGRIANANLAACLVPVNADLPPIEVRFLDYPDTILSPLGARGIGEIGIVGAAAAVAGAVHNATGRRVRDLPITVEKLLDSAPKN